MTLSCDSNDMYSTAWAIDHHGPHRAKQGRRVHRLIHLLDPRAALRWSLHCPLLKAEMQDLLQSMVSNKMYSLRR